MVALVAYLCCAVSKLGQDFGSVVWDDAHGVTGQVEFLQTGQGADVPDLLQLETHTHTQTTENEERERLDGREPSASINTDKLHRQVCLFINLSI